MEGMAEPLTGFGQKSKKVNLANYKLTPAKRAVKIKAKSKSNDAP